MGTNALTQIVVPPPKYVVDRLVRCEVADNAQLRRIFLLQRGYPSVGRVGHDEALEALLANTEDAYGFPPYRQVAPALVVGEQDYEHLRGRERQILERALLNVPVHQLVSESCAWAEGIPMLLGLWPPEGLEGRERRPELVAVPPVEHVNV